VCSYKVGSISACTFRQFLKLEVSIFAALSISVKSKISTASLLTQQLNCNSLSFLFVCVEARSDHIGHVTFQYCGPLFCTLLI